MRGCSGNGKSPSECIKNLKSSCVKSLKNEPRAKFARGIGLLNFNGNALSGLGSRNLHDLANSLSNSAVTTDNHTGIVLCNGKHKGDLILVKEGFDYVDTSSADERVEIYSNKNSSYRVTKSGVMVNASIMKPINEFLAAQKAAT